MKYQEPSKRLDALCYAIIGAAMEVHKTLGPGLLEAVYQKCLAMELEARGLAFESEKELPLLYKGKETGKTFRLDFLVEGDIVVELKAVDKLQPVHEVQLLTYLRLMEKRLGLLVNFNVAVLKEGVRRVINSKPVYTGIRPLRD